MRKLPSRCLEIDRGSRGTAYAVWERRDSFSGEEMPDVAFDWLWTAKSASAVDVLGLEIPAKVADGRLHLAVSLTPIFIEPGR